MTEIAIVLCEAGAYTVLVRVDVLYDVSRTVEVVLHDVDALGVSTMDGLYGTGVARTVVVLYDVSATVDAESHGVDVS